MLVRKDDVNQRFGRFNNNRNSFIRQSFRSRPMPRGNLRFFGTPYRPNNQFRGRSGYRGNNRSRPFGNSFQNRTYVCGLREADSEDEPDTQDHDDNEPDEDTDAFMSMDAHMVDEHGQPYSYEDLNEYTYTAHTNTPIIPHIPPPSSPPTSH